MDQRHRAHLQQATVAVLQALQGQGHDRRFDARSIGYTVGQVMGNGVYGGSRVGCYQFDPVAFRAALTARM